MKKELVNQILYGNSNLNKSYTGNSSYTIKCIKEVLLLISLIEEVIKTMLVK